MVFGSANKNMGGLIANEEYVLATVENQGKEFERVKKSFNTVGNMFPLMEAFDENKDDENKNAKEIKDKMQKVASETAALNNANVSDKMRTNNSDISQTEENKETDDMIKKRIKSDARATKRMNERNEEILTDIDEKMNQMERDNAELERKLKKLKNERRIMIFIRFSPRYSYYYR